MSITKFKCAVCGKISTGRTPKDGDGSFRYPRRHKINGVVCEGVYEEAEWVNDDLPKTLDEAVDYYLPKFKGPNWFNDSEDSFASFCHSMLSGGIGMNIRNELGLWTKDTDIYKHFVNVHNIEHPDDMSDLILRSIYRKKTKND